MFKAFHLTRPLGATLLASALTFAGSAVAEEHPYETQTAIKITFSADGLSTRDVVEQTTIESASAIQMLGQRKIVNNDHFGDLEIVEAATLKADGTRIDVPAARFFTQSGSEATAALFRADTTTHVIPFPDLAVGDRRLVHYRVKEKLLEIPGAIFGNFVAETGPNAATRTVTIEAPDALNLRFADRGMTHQEEAMPGGKRLTWRLEPAANHTFEPLAVSAFDRAPGFEVSNLADWNALGRAYGKLLDHAIDADPTVQAKADEITAGLTDRRAMAKAIYLWTSANIRYFNVVIGAGGFVPHKPADILAQRYGDCKDHATLLRALLAAKGIDSQFVLVNIASRYKATQLPAPFFDHMITYVPELAQYLDPTDPTGTFEVTPSYLADKPVLRLTPDGGIADRIPYGSASVPKVVFDAAIAIGADGLAKGSSSVEADGPPAEKLRGAAKQVALMGAEAAGRKELSGEDVAGSATLSAPSFLDKDASFKIGATFQLDHNYFSKDDDGVAIPTGPRIFNRPFATLLRGLKDKWQDDFVCGQPHDYVERIHLGWPAGYGLVKTPHDVDITRGLVSYKASYRLIPAGLEVERILQFRPVHAVCNPSDLAGAKGAIVAAARDASAKISLAKTSVDAAPILTDLSPRRDL